MAGVLPRILLFICLNSVCALGFPSASSLCPRSEDSRFLDDVRLQCPLWIERSSPLEVTGEILDRKLSHRQSNAYYSVLFYASWCPFSCKTWPTFDALSSMFPQIRHLAVEESSAMPSVLSRYGVHSFPSILIVNRTTRVQYHGSKDLNSLILFYKQTTGHDPVVYLSVDHTISSPRERVLLHPREMLTREPYLTFGLVFLCLKAFLYFFPGIIYQLKTLWALYVWPLNLVVLGESSQLLDRALHVVDMKKLWSKVRLSNKTRNFQKGAKNASVWASSLASVSLGESSSSRSASPDS